MVEKSTSLRSSKEADFEDEKEKGPYEDVAAEADVGEVFDDVRAIDLDESVRSFYRSLLTSWRSSVILHA